MLHYPADKKPLPVGHPIYLALNRLLDVLVYEHGFPLAHIDRLADVFPQALLIIDYLHPPASYHIAWPDHYRVAYLRGAAHRLSLVCRSCILRLLYPKLLEERLEFLPVLGNVYPFHLRPEYLNAAHGKLLRKVYRGLPAELHNHPFRVFVLHYVQYVLEGERLEVQPVRSVKVGAHGLRVVVYHDALYPHLAERERRVAAAVVEFDPLPDPYGPAADYHNLPSCGRHALVLAFISRIVIGRPRLELRSAGVHHLVDGHNPFLEPHVPHHGCLMAYGGRNLLIRVAHPFRLIQKPLAENLLPQAALHVRKVRKPVQKPRVYHGKPMHPFPVPAHFQRFNDGVYSKVGRRGKVLLDIPLVDFRPFHLNRAERLPKRFLKRPSDSHGFPCAFHLRPDDAVALRDFVKRPSWYLHHAVVKRGLECRRGGFRDRVLYLVQAKPERYLRRDPGNRVAGRL